MKRPEKETATTARDEGHDSSLSGAPSATSEDDCVKRMEPYGDQMAHYSVIQEIKNKMDLKVILYTHTHTFVTI